LLGFKHNSPAMKAVCVSAPIRILVLEQNYPGAEWRGFGRHGTNYGAYTSVAVQMTFIVRVS